MTGQALSPKQHCSLSPGIYIYHALLHWPRLSHTMTILTNHALLHWLRLSHNDDTDHCTNSLAFEMLTHWMGPSIYTPWPSIQTCVLSSTHTHTHNPLRSGVLTHTRPQTQLWSDGALRGCQQRCFGGWVRLAVVKAREKWKDILYVNR